MRTEQGISRYRVANCVDLNARCYGSGNIVMGMFVPHYVYVLCGDFLLFRLPDLFDLSQFCSVTHAAMICRADPGRGGGLSRQGVIIFAGVSLMVRLRMTRACCLRASSAWCFVCTLRIDGDFQRTFCRVIRASSCEISLPLSLFLFIYCSPYSCTESCIYEHTALFLTPS